MLARSAVATVAGIAALCGPALTTEPEAATPAHTLQVRPGVGIGPVNVGETFTVLQQQFPHITVRRELFRLRLDGKTIVGLVNANRVTNVHSTASNLVLGGRRLRNDPAGESQRLVNAGWKSSACIANHTLVYRRDAARGRVTVIAWAPGAPPFAEVTPRIPSAWTSCPSPGSAPS